MSGQPGILNSFGCRHGYESLGGPNPWATSGQNTTDESLTFGIKWLIPDTFAGCIRQNSIH